MQFERCFKCFEETGNSETCPHCGHVQTTQPKKPNFLVPGTILHGRYILGESLGAGGFGITYIAWDFEMERKVAIKEYFPAEFSTRSPGEISILVYDGEPRDRFNAGLKSFIDEAKRLAGLNSVNGIVHIFDVFSENNTAYIVMEYISGKSLKEILVEDKNNPEGNGGKLPYQQAVAYAVTILRELEAVHKMGIIHRDIAPDNIMISEDGKVKLIDFGASKNATSIYSKSYSVVFKSGYTPEEQYRSNGNQGPWTDIYAMSATIYRMVTGHVPYDANDRKSGKKVLKKPSELGIDIPANVEVAIMNGLNVYAENRYQSAGEFADVLEGAVPAKPIAEKIKVQSDYKLSRRSMILLASGLVVGLALFVVLISTGTLKTLTAERLPNVIEMSVEQAAGELSEYGYEYITDESGSVDAENKIRISDMIYDKVIPEDLILSQSPNAGAKVNRDKYPDIYLVLSAGAKEVFLPDDTMVGSLREDTVKLLKDLGLTVEIEEEYSNEIAENYVSRQEYEPGSKLHEGDTIKIWISKGPEETEKVKTTVPDVVGLTQEQAIDKIVASKLLMAVKSEEYSETVPKGRVIRQSPKAGSKAVSGEGVEVIISKGAKSEETTRVPDVVYRKQKTAESMLKNAGLRCDIKYSYSNNVASGTVMSQSVAPDSKVKVNTLVVITVSKGAKNDSDAQRKQAETTVKPTEKKTEKQTKKTKEKVTEKRTEKNTEKTTEKRTEKHTEKITEPTTTRKKIKIANVVGTPATSAKNTLSDFTVSITYGYCDSVASGYVIKQSPTAGTEAHEGSLVELIVSRGSKEKNFSAWSTTKPTGNVIVQQKSQYRDKITTVSGYDNLTGYEGKTTKVLTDKTYSNQTYDYKPTDKSNVYNNKRQETYYYNIKKAYVSYFWVKPSNSGMWYEPQSTDSYKITIHSQYKGSSVGNDNYHYFYRTPATISEGYSYSSIGKIYGIYKQYYNGNVIREVSTFTLPNRDKTEPYITDDIVYYADYRYREIQYTYWKWGPWIDGGTTNSESQTQIVYRSCPKYNTYDSNGNIIS